MLSAFPQGGLIRKLWIEEVAEFKSAPTASRSNCRRDQRRRGIRRVPRNYAKTSVSLDTVLHAFHLNRAMRGAPELGPPGPAHRDMLSM